LITLSNLGHLLTQTKSKGAEESKENNDHSMNFSYSRTGIKTADIIKSNSNNTGNTANT
jgi:hypothetical protein